jgi:hypothetical protein
LLDPGDPTISLLDVIRGRINLYRKKKKKKRDDRAGEIRS